MADMGGGKVFLSRVFIHFNFVDGPKKTCYMKIVGMGVMRNSIQIKLYDIFRKDLHLPDERARELVQTIDEAVKGEYADNLEGVATKDFVRDFVKEEIHNLELKMTKAIYISSLIQFLAIVGSVIAIFNFMQHK